MTTAYTSLLGLALPVTGELDGTWGDTVNNYITEYTDASIAGVQTISGSQTAVTLSKTTGSSLSQAGSGATGSSQYQIINCTGNPASLLTITAPATSKTYVVINATSTSQSVKIVGAGPTTGVTVPSGRKVFVAWNGSDFVSVAGGLVNLATDVTGTLGATNGGTAQSTYTTGDTLYASASNTLAKLPVGSAGQVLTVAGGIPVWATPASGLPSQTGNAGKYLTTDGTNASWSSTGAAADGAIYINNTTITSNYTIAAGTNGFSVGPITQAPGVTVTITAGQRWVVL
jgi:hypothetical protein